MNLIVKNKKIRSVVDSYVASYIELSEFKSQQRRFLQMFFLYILFFYVLILSFALEHFLIFFFLSFHNLSLSLSLSLSLNIVFFFYHLSNDIKINFSPLHLTNFLLS